MEIDIKVSGNDKITIKLEEKRDKKENNTIIGKRAEELKYIVMTHDLYILIQMELII